jgi:hypothetical protein
MALVKIDYQTALEWNLVYALRANTVESGRPIEVLVFADVPDIAPGKDFRNIIVDEDARTIWVRAKYDTRFTKFGTLAIDLSKVVSVFRADGNKSSIIIRLDAKRSFPFPIDDNTAMAILAFAGGGH